MYKINKIPNVPVLFTDCVSHKNSFSYNTKGNVILNPLNLLNGVQYLLLTVSVLRLRQENLQVNFKIPCYKKSWDLEYPVNHLTIRYYSGIIYIDCLICLLLNEVIFLLNTLTQKM